MERDHPSSLIQVARFGESPKIVPDEVRDSGLNVANWGALAEKMCCSEGPWPSLSA
jgi:hypothetical protein